MIEDARIVDAIWINNEGAHQAAEFDEMMPVRPLRARRELNAKHGANLSRADFGNEMLESRTLHLAGRERPRSSSMISTAGSQVGERGRQAILPALAFLVVNHLSRR